MADTANKTKNKKPAAAARVEPQVAVGKIEGFEPPAPATSGAKYPFDSLEVGEYFSVSNKTKGQMASAVTNANRRYTNTAKNAEGQEIKVRSREFYSVTPDAATAAKLLGTVHEGAKVLVIRKA